MVFDHAPWNESWNERPSPAYHDGMARAASGHLEQLPSGSYRVHVYAGTDPLTGRELRHRQTVKTEEQAQILLGKLLAQAAEGRQPETGVTVAELLRRYLAVTELDRSTECHPVLGLTSHRSPNRNA
jgi:integrase